MEQELVGKVRRDLQSAWTDSKDPGDGWWDFMARYALALAERAACEGLAAGEQIGDVEAPPHYYKASEYAGGDTAVEVVRRAVEGT